MSLEKRARWSTEWRQKLLQKLKAAPGECLENAVLQN